MSLLNRSTKLKNNTYDEVPLISKKDSNHNNTTSSSHSVTEINYSDDEDEDMYNEKPFRKNDITLWVSDAIVLIVEHLQYYAVLLALSEHWGWPVSWIDSTSFTFIFNLDIWEFRKVETGLFHHSTSAFIDTSKLGFNYASYISAWAVILCFVIGVFAVVYVRWMKQRPLYLLLYIARWKRVMFLVLQFVSVPFGVAAARVFHCRMDVRGKEVMVVQNEFVCYTGTHVAFMALVLIIFLFLFFIYPFILMKWVREQVFSGDPKRHEGFLQLKEAEYEQGLDILWDLGQYHLFSSYKRAWILYNPLKFIFKLAFVAGFAMSVRSPFWASASITFLFCLAVMALICKRPFRVRCFNFMIITSHFLIACDALIGNFMVRPPWEPADTFQLVSFLRAPALTYILIAINCSWLVILFCWIIYLVLLNRGWISDERIWPRLSYTSSNAIGEDTKKYLKAALKARQILEKALAAIPLFAPVHELSHQIQVVNAYCREAEYIADPTHDTLWDLLDELIEAHNALSSVSVFGLSGKSSVKETSEEFIRLMPAFRRRLKQREYDFILVPAVKRRLLLKMYILSVFVNNKYKKQSAAENVTTKLQNALATFDTRSLMSDFTESVSASSHPRSDGVSTTRVPSDMTSFINDVDHLVGDIDEQKSSSSGRSSKSVKSLTGSTSSQRSVRSSAPSQRFSVPVLNDKVPELTLRPGTAPLLSPPTKERPRRQTSSASVRFNNSSSAVSMNRDMPSSTSLPGQIDDDEQIPKDIRQSSTIL